MLFMVCRYKVRLLLQYDTSNLTVTLCINVNQQQLAKKRAMLSGIALFCLFGRLRVVHCGFCRTDC